MTDTSLPSFQQQFWDGPGAAKTFTHEVCWDWLSDVPLNAVVLDYGCGYGRLVRDFRARGFQNVFGVDPSAALIERGSRDLDGLMVMDEPPRVPEAVPTADLALLFAVVTCVPDDQAQASLLAAVWQAIRPGGYLYLADFGMSGDPSRYERLQLAGMPLGTFTTDDGGNFRHHTLEHLRSLVGGAVLHEREIPMLTMNGRSARGIQLLFQKTA